MTIGIPTHTVTRRVKDQNSWQAIYNCKAVPKLVQYMGVKLSKVKSSVIYTVNLNTEIADED